MSGGWEIEQKWQGHGWPDAFWDWKPVPVVVIVSSPVPIKYRSCCHGAHVLPRSGGRQPVPRLIAVPHAHGGIRFAEPHPARGGIAPTVRSAHSERNSWGSEQRHIARPTPT